MASFVYLKFLLITLALLCFNNIAWAREDVNPAPNSPAFVVPEGITDDQEGIFRRTFQDAIYLARFTTLYWPCDPANDETFTRYFELSDGDFVKNIFRAIANIDFGLDLTDQDNVDQLASQALGYSDKFRKLSISFLQEHPGLKDPGVPPQQQTCQDPRTLGFTVPTSGGAFALMSVCPQLYEQIPMLQDIESPQTWAMDPSKDQSGTPQYYNGYGCDNLGDTDSTWMSSTGSILLHEIMHFPGLFSDVPDYAANIVTWFDANTPHFISDYFGMWPQDGYGPYNAAEIKRYLPLDYDDFLWKPIYNADNYVMYALSKYYSQKCGKVFKEAPSENDAAKDRHLPPNPFPITDSHSI